MRVYKAIVFALFFIFINSNAGFSQPSLGGIDKMRQDMEMERALRTEVEKGKKVYIKNIVVKGVTLISKGRLSEIIPPFKDHWLGESDINLLLESITNAYKEKGYAGEPAKISFRVKKGVLQINIEELRHGKEIN